MRKIILVFAAIAAMAGAASVAGAVPAGSLAGLKQAAESSVVQVHRGPHACHYVRGRWWRDTRPYSRPGCWGGWRRHHHHHPHRGRWHWHRGWWH